MTSSANAIRRLLLGWLALVSVGCGAVPAHTEPVRPEHVVTKPKGTVVFVLSAARQQALSDGTRRETGTFLGEMYQPYVALTSSGHDVVLATIDGQTPTIDPESLDDDYWASPNERAQAERLTHSSMWQRPLGLRDVLAQVDTFDGLVVPGGQGVMVDLLDEPHLHGLLRTFGAHDKPVGLICHAPAVLTRLTPPHAFGSRTVTSVSGFEEFFIETFVMGSNAQFRNVGEQLERAGYEHTSGFPGREFAVRDCNLVTSQNPFSSGRFGELYLDALNDYRRGARCVRRVTR